MLRKDDSLRCQMTEQCLEKVHSGSAVFVTCKKILTSDLNI